jgi:nicotinate phosphoribosyltransferase
MPPSYPIPPASLDTPSYLDNDDKVSPSGTTSILDTDWYKLSMMQAIMAHYPEAVVVYRYKTRNPTRDIFTKEAFEALRTKVYNLESVVLTDEEEKWLLENTPYLQPDFVAKLKQFRFRPREQVKLHLTPEGIIEIDVQGKWSETILYEVPVLALISETFFELMETDWDYRNPQDQRELARSKIAELFANDIYFSDFGGYELEVLVEGVLQSDDAVITGTRRRRSYRAQETIVRELARAHFKEIKETGRAFSHASGTSNVHFARLYNLRPVGTVAHEW